MKRLMIASILALFAAFPVWAHEVKNGPNGGRVAEAGDYHVELVAKDKSIDVFVTDHNDKTISPTGYKGLAILVVDGKSQRIVLTPETNKLSGQATGSVRGQPRGVVQITPPGGKTAQAKFN